MTPDGAPARPTSRAAGDPRRLATLPPYPLAGIPEARARLLAAGRDVLDLGAGDPGLPIPDTAVEALREAAGRPELQGYGFQRGLPAYRAAVAAFMERRYGRTLDPDREILPLIGSKEGLALAAFAAVDPGDTVLAPDPGYAPYFGGPHFAGARLERVRLVRETGFTVPPAAIGDAPGTLRLVYLNYPNNPTGATVERSYVTACVEACARRGALLAYDNAYAEIGFSGYRPPGLLEIEGGLETGIEFHSFSKSFNMTGWRLGWACGSAEWITRLAKVKSFIDTGPYLALQHAGSAVLAEAEPYLERNRARLEIRRDAAVAAFRSAGFDLEPPRGALYLWLRIPTTEPARDFALRVLEEQAVVLLPGSALGEGGEGYVRAALTLPAEGYDEAAARIARAL